MDTSQLFDGTAFCAPQNASVPIYPAALIILDLLPPCACGAPSDAALLRTVGALIDGGFAGVRELKKAEPGTAPNLVLAYLDPVKYRPLFLWIDPGSIEGGAILLLLNEIKSGTARTDLDLAAYGFHVVEVGYKRAGRSEEFNAAVQRALDAQKVAWALQ